MKQFPFIKLLAVLLLAITVVNNCKNSAQKSSSLPTLPDKPNRWLKELSIPEGAKVVLIEPDPWYTRLGLPWPPPEAKRIKVSKIKVGELVAGIEVGAIQCTYHNKNAGFGREQYMWRDKWNCIAAQDRQIIEEEYRHSLGERIINYPHLIAFRLSL
jgi:hypothetical protein